MRKMTHRLSGRSEGSLDNKLRFILVLSRTNDNTKLTAMLMIIMSVNAYIFISSISFDQAADTHKYPLLNDVSLPIVLFGNMVR